jgi:hypothetical protein
MKSLAHTHRTVDALHSVSAKCVSVAPGQLLPVPDSAHSRHRLVFAQVRRLLLQPP